MPPLLRGTLHALGAQAAAFEALLLIASASHKAFKWPHLKDVVRQFGGVRPSLAPVALSVVAMSEMVAGGLLWVPALRTPGALLAGAIWTLYLLLIVRAIVQGRRDADCGCSFGPQRPLGAFQVARNALLWVLAAGVVLAGGDASGAGPPAAQLLAACALLALYGALDQVMGLRPLRSGEVS